MASPPRVPSLYEVLLLVLTTIICYLSVTHSATSQSRKVRKNKGLFWLTVQSSEVTSPHQKIVLMPADAEWHVAWHRVSTDRILVFLLTTKLPTLVTLPRLYLSMSWLQGWRESYTAKGSCCSFRGWEFNSQHPQTPATPAPGDLITSSGLPLVPYACDINTQRYTTVHTKKLKEISSNKPPC